MTDAASLADRVREGDLRLHELEAHADADTPPPARADCSSDRSPARRSTRSGTTASPRRPPVRHREHGRLDPGADGRRRPRQRRRRLRRRRKYLPSRPPRARAPRVGQPRFARSSTAPAADRPRPQVQDDPRAGVPRRRRCRGRGARLVDPRQLRGAEGGRGGDDEPRRTPRRDAVRRRQLGVPTIPLRHQGRDGDEHGHHRHRGAVCGVVEAETAASLVALSGQPLFRQEARRHQRRRGARPERHRRRSDPARGSSKNACTPRQKRSRNSTHARTWSAPRRPRASGSTPTSPTSSPRCSLATGQDEGAGRRGRERHHDRRGAGRRPLRLGLHRLPSKSAPSAAARNSDAVRGLDILGVSGGGDPPAPTPTPSPDASPSVPSRANSPFSPRSPRGTSPAPTPNSVGNCMGVVVRPRFMGSEFVDPTLIMNVLSREIPRGLRDTRRYNAYHEHITKGWFNHEPASVSDLLCNLRPNRQRLNRLVSFFG